MAFLKKLSALLSSFGFVAIILVFLTLLTFLGTLEQVEHGLFETQKKYFDSLWLVHWFGPIPVPLPGVYLLLALLLVNLVWGGIVRMRKDVARLGILVAHLGIVLMLVAGFVKYRYSIDGSMQLWPRVDPDEFAKYYGHRPGVHDRSESDEFLSFFDWELTIREAVPEGRITEYVIPHSEWETRVEDGPITFVNDALPFDFVVKSWAKNCFVVPKDVRPPMMKAADVSPIVDGYVMWRQPLVPEAEANRAGLLATLRDKTTGKMTDALFWGSGFVPLTIEAGGKHWLLHLQRKRWKLPFTIALDKFTFEMHPGTGHAAVFLSDATVIADGLEKKVKITMNEPLRREGFTLFQSQYGPSNVPEEAPHYSVFAVVQNPSDQWPKYSCFVIAAGLLFHFSMKLMKYVRSENRLARPVGAPVDPRPAVMKEGAAEPDEPLAAGAKKH